MELIVQVTVHKAVTDTAQLLDYKLCEWFVLMEHVCLAYHFPHIHA